MWLKGDDDKKCVTKLFPEDKKRIEEKTDIFQREVGQCYKVINAFNNGELTTYDKTIELLNCTIELEWEDFKKNVNLEYKNTINDLVKFLKNEILPNRLYFLSYYKNYNSIKEQTKGNSFDTEKLERLAKYETFLDRKLQKILSMLIRLKELRNNDKKLTQKTLF